MKRAVFFWALAVAGWLVVSHVQAATARTIPIADLVFNVALPSLGGVDNAGCTQQPQANPCATPQYAFDALYADYDLQCKFKATIQLAAAPAPGQNYYPGVNISGRPVGQCGTLKPLTVGPGKPPFGIGKYLPITLQGDPANPLGAFLNPGNGGRPGGACISLSDGASLRVTGIACDTAFAAQDGFDIYSNSFMDMSHVWFGNAGMPGSTYSNHISVGFGSTLIITGDYGLSGSAMAHINAGANATVDYENNGDPALPINVTILNNPTFTAGFMLIDDSLLYAQGINYIGDAIGPRATVLRNGVIETNTGNGTSHSCSATYFPGTGAPVILDNAVCR